MSIKRRAGALDAVVLNGWAMLAAGLLLLSVSAAAEVWVVSWSPRAVGSIAYLALIGSAVPFVTLTILLRELPAVTMSYITLLLPFGALAFGALLYDERSRCRRSAARRWWRRGSWPARRRAVTAA